MSLKPETVTRPQNLFLRRVALGLALLASVFVTVEPGFGDDRVPGDVIRDRIRSRIEKGRVDRTPVLGGSTASPGAGARFESVLIKGQVRTFTRYTPNAVLVSGKRAPVVFALHDEHGSAERLQPYLGLNALADKEGFIVVYPQGDGQRWTEVQSSAQTDVRQGGAVDDSAFLNALADALAGQGVADAARIYLIGIGQGGAMALRLWCSNEHSFAAIAAVAASLPRDGLSSCAPRSPVPVMLVNGTADPVIAFDGKEGGKNAPYLPPVEAAQFLAKAAGCAGSSDEALPDVAKDDGTTAFITSYKSCEKGRAQLVTVKGGGHHAPSTHTPALATRIDTMVGPRSRDFDTGDVAWKFFNREPR